LDWDHIKRKCLQVSYGVLPAADLEKIMNATSAHEMEKAILRVVEQANPDTATALMDDVAIEAHFADGFDTHSFVKAELQGAATCSPVAAQPLRGFA
jgi:hypothetical protein